MIKKPPLRPPPHPGFKLAELKPGVVYRDVVSGRRVFVLPSLKAHKAIPGSEVPYEGLVYNLVHGHVQSMQLKDHQLIPLTDPWTP